MSLLHAKYSLENHSRLWSHVAMKCWPLPLIITACAVILNCSAAMNEDTLRTIHRLRDEGKFSQATTRINGALEEKGISAGDRKALLWELDLLGRIRQDFSLTEPALFARLHKSVKNLTRAEFDRWIAQGRFESRVIDGTRYYTGTSVSNLYFRHPELTSRRNDPRDISHYREMLANARAIKRAAAEQKSNYVLPHRYKMTMTVTAKADAASPGETVRAWLPIPRKYPFQDGFKLISSSSPVKYLADENNPIRSIYLEQAAEASQPTRFQISYEYERRAVHFPMKAEDVAPYNLNDPEIKKFTAEAPHVVFTDEIKKLSSKIVGKETNPLLKARKIYDWIGDNLKYSYALEYSTIPNISEYCRANGFGDCGQQALLFITLCRSQGIPARWQSGWIIFPGHKNIHDWTEINIAPYGWVPVDPEVGNALLQYATNLTPEERREAHDFYFGGLDQYRMIANSDHSQQLQPPKQTFRSDDVDFQRGELEAGAKNIYFDNYSYKMEIEYPSSK